ncbi:MAG TPA: class III extradiol ring-cleavage dioxygenase [Afifellaceae bacterium]|nr:class III extradiol ring-cleavage dioxygenase [Afifellaceae bacterium]
MAKIAPIFVSHGAPDLAITQTAAHDFLKSYGRSGARPKAILTVSAHFETADPVLVTDPAPEMIYDFGGFDPALRTIVYPAPGAPDISRLAFEAIEAAGFDPKLAEKRGYDHGVWVPLMLLYPEADIPVAQLSVDPNRDPAWHYRLGEALRPLTEQGVLIVGSGSLTHNLGEVFTPAGLRRRDEDAPQWVDDFAAWIAERLAEGDVDLLLDYRRQAPFAVENHPTDEHLLPLFVALGAAGHQALGRRLHDSREFGVLAMDAYAFNAEQAA